MNMIILSAIALITITPPWARQVERRTPWGNSTSEVRKERRESFFDRLSFLDPEPKSEKKELVVEEVKRDEDNPENNTEEDLDGLSDLPWKSYQKEYQQGVLPSTLVWPVEGGSLVSGYGYRGGQVHEGLDVSGKRGDLVRAVAPGRVTYVGHMRGYGRLLVIAHGNGYSTIYAHNMAHLVKVGGIVESGQPIAHLGQSGNARGYHVHFEVRRNGKPVNPLEFKFQGSPLVASR